jgi:outer membrane protein OmpA-like peptidoglycan-associated protein
MKTIKHLTLIVVAFLTIATGCKTLNRSQKGGAIGAAGGGVIGAVVGKALGNTAMGAIIGAAVGGTTGAVIGRKMDKQAEEMKKVLGDAEVRRVGEGIVIEFKEKILFGFNRSDLNASARRNLSKLSDVLKKYPDTNIEVIGHTDDKGTSEYNQTLSQKRAASVSSYLKTNSIGSSRLVIKGMGESDPKVANDSDANRAETAVWSLLSQLIRKWWKKQNVRPDNNLVTLSINNKLKNDEY